MSEIHELQQMINRLLERDKNSVDEINDFFGRGPTIENRIALADGRAMDALHAVMTLARYIIEQEAKCPKS